MKNEYKNKVRELESFKEELLATIGKNEKLNRFDFEKYIKCKYNAKFYDSLQEYYDKNGIDLKVDDIRDFVDYLAFDIVESSYRVTEIKGNYFKNAKYGSTFVYYSYEKDKIVDMFIHNSGIKYSLYWGVFRDDGEKIIRQNLQRVYN